MTSLLDRVETHLNAGGLLDGYTVRQIRWTDADIAQTGQVILFREAGTAGESDFVVQKPRVHVEMITDPDQVVEGRERMREITQYLRTNYKDTDVVHFQPIGAVASPKYLQNDRAIFRLTVELIVQDH